MTSGDADISSRQSKVLIMRKLERQATRHGDRRPMIADRRGAKVEVAEAQRHHRRESHQAATCAKRARSMRGVTRQHSASVTRLLYASPPHIVADMLELSPGIIAAPPLRARFAVIYPTISDDRATMS